jgi:hypothetical protein
MPNAGMTSLANIQSATNSKMMPKQRNDNDFTDTFQETLRAADLLLITRIEIQNRVDILADLIAFGSGFGSDRLSLCCRENGGLLHRADAR